MMQVNLSKIPSAVLVARATGDRIERTETKIKDALAQLGIIDSRARCGKGGSCALDPSFTIRRFRSGAASENLLYLARRERLIEGICNAYLTGFNTTTAILTSHAIGSNNKR
jgi:hypothetical protein